MTRKDYILIANALRMAVKDMSYSDAQISGILSATNNYLSLALKQQNPRFDREHFLAVVRGEKDLKSRPSRR